MAYNLRYYNEFTSKHYKRLVRVEILERDYTGNSERISMGASVHLSDSGDDRHEPIKKLTASLRLLSTRNFQFEHLFTADDKKYQVRIYRNSGIIFRGFLESDSYSEPYYTWKNYTVDLTARDNLGRLEDVDYLDDDGNRVAGLESAISIFHRAINKVGYSVNIYDFIRIWSSDMDVNTTVLQQTYINNDAFWNFEDNEPYDCLYVITEMLKAFGSQIRQIAGTWSIVDQAKYYNRPTIQGNSAAFPSYLAEKLNFPKVEKAFKWINSDAEMTILPAWKSFKISQDFLNYESFFTDFPKNNSYFTQGEKLPTSFPYLENNNYYYCDIPSWNLNGNDVLFNPARPTYIILPDSGSDYILKSLDSVKSTSEPMFITLPYSTKRIKIGSLIDSTIDIYIDVIVSNETESKILTDDGWTTYTNQTKELKFNNVSLNQTSTIDLSLITDGVPIDGELVIRFWGGSFASLISGATSLIALHDICIAFSNEDLKSEIECVVNSDNNLIPDEVEMVIGQVYNYTNSNITFKGGLFDFNGNAQKEWKREGDIVAENLLKKIAIGYDLQNRQSSRQVNGTVIWDYDLWTNISDQDKVLMLNSCDEWNLNTDEMSAEFVEVFEYKNTKGAFDDGFNDGFDNSDSEGYKTNSIFTLTEKIE